MPLVSVVVATYNRAPLLHRALSSYSRQSLKDWEYILIDDGSVDNTKEVTDYWIATGLPIRYYTASEIGKPKELGKWRDGCSLRNAGSTFANGRFIVSTHPEIIIPSNALALMATSLGEADVWATAIPYWLPRDAQSLTDDVHALRTASGFFDPSWPLSIDTPGAPDYRNQNQERRTDWESEVFWGMRMSTWRAMGGFREFDVWGSVDMDFWSRRRAYGLPTRIVKDPLSPAPSGNLMVYHQWHESPRDMPAAMQAVRGITYPTAESVSKTGGLYPVYNHGPRERGRSLAEIMPDHLLRYEWAYQFIASFQDVLDVPCGTGYGSHILSRAPRVQVTGVDIDEESIEWAKTYWSSVGTHFKVGDMLRLPLVDNSIDQVVSFEGIEHISPSIRQIEVMTEFWRVLRPGGRFVLSTPQKGATGGTHWDLSLLSHDELRVMVNSLGWKNVDWFSQAFYGGPHPIKYGVDPKAEIMLVGGTKPLTIS